MKRCRRRKEDRSNSKTLRSKMLVSILVDRVALRTWHKRLKGAALRGRSGGLDGIQVAFLISTLARKAGHAL